MYCTITKMVFRKSPAFGHSLKRYGPLVVEIFRRLFDAYFEAVIKLT